MEYNDRRIGIIAAGTAYTYAKEALGERASFFKLGMVNPLPIQSLIDFARNVGQVYVIEELDDIIETHCLKHGIPVIGKLLFSSCGEFSQATVREALMGEEKKHAQFDGTIPARPPVLCAGCPHRGLFYALKKCKVYVSGDIGCYTLGASAPLSAIDVCVCMGASISGLHGFNTAGARSRPPGPWR